MLDPQSATLSAVTIPADGARLAGDLTVPEAAVGIVAFAHGSGSSRHSPRNRQVAERLVAARLGSTSSPTTKRGATCAPASCACDWFLIALTDSWRDGRGPGLTVAPAAAPDIDDAVIETDGLELYVEGEALEMLDDKVFDADDDGDTVRFSVHD